MSGELRMAVLRLLHSTLAWLLAHLRAASSRLEQLRQQLATSSRSDALPPLSPREALRSLWGHIETWLTAQANRIVAYGQPARAPIRALLLTRRAGIRVTYARASIMARAAKAKCRRFKLVRLVRARILAFSLDRSVHARTARSAIRILRSLVRDHSFYVRKARNAARILLSSVGRDRSSYVRAARVAYRLGSDLSARARPALDAVRTHVARLRFVGARLIAEHRGGAGLRALAGWGATAILAAGKQLQSAAHAVLAAAQRQAAAYRKARLHAAANRAQSKPSEHGLAERADSAADVAAHADWGHLSAAPRSVPQWADSPPAVAERTEVGHGLAEWLAAPHNAAERAGAGDRLPAPRGVAGWPDAEAAEESVGLAELMASDQTPVGLAELMASDQTAVVEPDELMAAVRESAGLTASDRTAAMEEGHGRAQRAPGRRGGSGFAGVVKVAAACVMVLAAIAAVGVWSGRQGDKRAKTVMAQPSTAAPSPTPLVVEAAAPVEAVPRVIPLSQRNPITGPDRPPLPYDESGPFGSRRTTGTYEVALTFDDGPDPRYTPVVLELLRTYHIKATFCLIGVNVIQFPELVRAIAAEGHTLCNHSWVHDTGLGNRGHSTIVSDMVRTNDAIRAAAPGSRVSYFRHPGGMWTQAAVNSAQQLGMTSLHWDVDPRDWLKPGPRAISNTVTGSTQPGSIVLLHDGGGDRQGTVEALRSILPNLFSRFRLVALPPGIDPPRLYGIHLPIHAGQQ